MLWYFWETHCLSSLASRSATLSSMRKMSSSSAEKERAMVLQEEGRSAHGSAPKSRSGR